MKAVQDILLFQTRLSGRLANICPVAVVSLVAGFAAFGSDFSQSGRPAAVLTLQVSFFDASDTKRRPLLWQKNYSRRVPLQRPTAAAVMGGWDGALDEIMTEVSNDLAGGATPPA
jgi:hypothetical protein